MERVCALFSQKYVWNPVICEVCANCENYSELMRKKFLLGIFGDYENFGFRSVWAKFTRKIVLKLIINWEIFHNFKCNYAWKCENVMLFSVSSVKFTWTNLSPSICCVNKTSVSKLEEEKNVLKLLKTSYQRNKTYIIVKWWL